MSTQTGQGHGDAATVVEALEGALSDSGRVLAVDVPSGLHPDTGKVGDVFLAADVTVTFGGVKKGLVEGPARGMVGEIVLAEIGIEENLAKMQPAGWARVAESLRGGADVKSP